jgi:hypothetical protein
MATKKRTPKTAPLPSPIARPPAERWQHGVKAEEDFVEPEAATRTQRLRTGLRQLYAAGTIGDRELSASTRW